MRTAPFAPYPLFLLPMPDGGGRRRWPRALHARGEEVGGANGALPAARSFADETARLTGGDVRGRRAHPAASSSASWSSRAPAPGRLRPATEDDAGLALDWFRAFHADADEQAGRTGDGRRRRGHFDLDDMSGRIAAGGSGSGWTTAGRVHLTGANPPAFGVARVGPVYTPREHRGRGYAGAAVAEVSRRLVAEGARACLFTDQANPTSNRIYEASATGRSWTWRTSGRARARPR